MYQVSRNHVSLVSTAIGEDGTPVTAHSNVTWSASTLDTGCADRLCCACCAGFFIRGVAFGTANELSGYSDVYDHC